MRIGRGLGAALACVVVVGCYGGPASSASPELPSGSADAAATLGGDAPTLDPGASVPTAEPDPATAAPTPAPTPRPEPHVALLINGVDGDPPRIGIVDGDTADIDLSLVTADLRRSDCTIKHRHVPDVPGGAETIDDLAPKAEQTVALTDGWHYFTARCPSIDGMLKSEMAALGADNLPERCAGFDFPNGPVTAATLAELEAGIVGRWEGCVTTPWWPVYWAEFTFRSDGTYSGVAHEVLDDWHTRPLYYDTNAESAQKQWRVDGFVGGVGTGELDLVLDGGSVVEDELTDIRLMGDALSFEFLHRGQYGPLVVRLVRS